MHIQLNENISMKELYRIRQIDVCIPMTVIAYTHTIHKSIEVYIERERV
jgi:hypothetical protein